MSSKQTDEIKKSLSVWKTFSKTRNAKNSAENHVILVLKNYYKNSRQIVKFKLNI